MFLTRFTINPARRGAHKLLGSPQAMHAAVLSAFPPPAAPAGGGSRVLWRVDRRSKTDVQLFIASPGRPDLSHLVEQAGWPTTETWQTKPYDPLLERLDAGQSWGFRIKANPVHQVKVQGRERSQPIGHVTVAQQRQWLLDRSDRNGFKIVDGPDGEPDVVVHDRENLRFRRGDNMVTLSTATYTGLLTVTDAAALRTALTQGIGRAKGYGCGLLTLAPVAPG